MAKKKTIVIDYMDNNTEVPENIASQAVDIPFLSKAFFETYQIKKHVTVAPTYVPKNFYEQICFFDDGVDIKLYLYINNTWRSVALA